VYQVFVQFFLGWKLSPLTNKPLGPYASGGLFGLTLDWMMKTEDQQDGTLHGHFLVTLAGHDRLSERLNALRTDPVAQRASLERLNSYISSHVVSQIEFPRARTAPPASLELPASSLPQPSASPAASSLPQPSPASSVPQPASSTTTGTSSPVAEALKREDDLCPDNNCGGRLKVISLHRYATLLFCSFNLANSHQLVLCVNHVVQCVLLAYKNSGPSGRVTRTTKMIMTLPY
jgi:hypothetical protein